MNAMIMQTTEATPDAPHRTEDVGAPARRVGLCVDDFGMHDGVNEAVLRLGAVSRLSAVGCLVDGPAFVDGARSIGRCWREDAGVAVGLHLDLTGGYTSVSQPLPALIARACLGGLSASTVRREIERQLDRFEATLGMPPDFVDGHQHVHQLPGVRGPLVDSLQRRYAGRLPWLRSTRRPARVDHAAFKARVIERLGAAGLARLARAGGFAQNEHLLGVYAFDEVAGGYQRLTWQWLAASVDGDLLMCHPSAPTAAADPLLPARLREYRWLTSRGFGRMLADAGVTIGLGDALRR